MMRKTSIIGALALAVTALGCVQNRPARNGVFNENQYVRKSFLVAPGDGSQIDNGWLMRASLTQVSTPNPLGDAFFLTPGLESGGALVRFVVTQDKLALVNMRELTNVKSDERVPEIVNAWPATNVDLKYRVNLDGENTNFYEENQELDWQVRQWVKLNFAKNDFSDIIPMGSFLNDALEKCTDVTYGSTELVPGSFRVDEKNNYMQWAVSVTLTLKWDDATCVTAFGALGDEALKIGRTNVSFTLMYSFTRAQAAPTYKTMEVAEKDPIRHKYGFFDYTTFARDENSGLLAARQLVQRFDPEKPIVWYFTKNFPENYKAFFRNPAAADDLNTIKGHTNKLLTDAGVKARVDFLEADDPTGAPDGAETITDAANNKKLKYPRVYGDVRYNMLVWMTDRDTQAGFAGLTQFTTDPRTGETVSASILLNDFQIKDYYVQRIDAYLQSIGASYGINSVDMNGKPDIWKDDGPCSDGDTKPLIPDTVMNQHNGNSSVYGKMQQYLQKPQSQFGNLGPQDFIVTQDDDFFKAYYGLLPYLVFADPDMNQFVIREGGKGVYGAGAFWDKLKKETEFQQMAARIDRGEQPYNALGAKGLENATAFLNNFRSLTLAHKDYVYSRDWIMGRMKQRADTPDAFSFESVIARDARHCVSGKWETKEEWTNNLISTYWSQVAWHEFGHSLGLTHNFMASVDRPNFPVYKDAAGRPHYGLYASSVMEYNASPDRVFWKQGWAPYDQGTISFIYANTAPSGPSGNSISGQSSTTDPKFAAPWKDPHGFDAMSGKETQYLYCSHQHLAFTPLCRQGDLGSTPSQIIANQIDAYEWQYKWNNFRQYRKFWDNSAYANIPAGLIVDTRKFLSMWIYDWGSSNLADTFRRIGIQNPDPNGSQLQYYQQLTNKFNAEASGANQMVAAFHKAIIQQSAGERPYRTIYDKFYGDVTQQGIILDKLFAMQGWVALWPSDNYDPNQSGAYIASYAGIGDASFNYIAEDAVSSMIGGQYDVYPYFVPLAVAQFAQDTHSPSFFGRIEIRDWIGGHRFYRLQDFLDYFRQIAVENNYPGCDTVAGCKYDPRVVSDLHNEFLGPDKRIWIWVYVIDRNQWVAVEKDRNIASYIVLRNYTDDVVYQMDDGAFPGGAYGRLLPIKYLLDSFDLYN